jgi:hypothetical protein
MKTSSRLLALTVAGLTGGLLATEAFASDDLKCTDSQVKCKVNDCAGHGSDGKNGCAAFECVANQEECDSRIAEVAEASKKSKSKPAKAKKK